MEAGADAGVGLAYHPEVSRLECVYQAAPVAHTAPEYRISIYQVQRKRVGCPVMPLSQLPRSAAFVVTAVGALLFAIQYPHGHETAHAAAARNAWYSCAEQARTHRQFTRTYELVSNVCQQHSPSWTSSCRDLLCAASYRQLQTLTGAPVEPGEKGESKGGLPPELVPFAQPSVETLSNSPRKVVAHWHQFPISRSPAGPVGDPYATDDRFRLRPLARPARSEPDWLLSDAKVEIKWAADIGIDAFFVNMYYEDQKNPYSWPHYITMLKAAGALNTPFGIAPNIDCSNGTDDGVGVANAIAEILWRSGVFFSPNQFKVNGKFIVGSYMANNCTVRFWRDLKRTLQRRGLEPGLMCVFLGGAYRSEYDSVCDIWSDWGSRNPMQAAKSDYSTRYAQVAGREPIAAAILHGDVRYHHGCEDCYPSADEQRGSETLRTNWEEAINTGASWAQLVTWNDIYEHSQAYPNTAEQYAMYDLSAYYIGLFKAGKPLVINKDAIYYFHRLAAVPAGTMPLLRAGKWDNIIEVVAFLTAPATIEIITDEGETRADVTAGMQVVTAPLPSSGKPKFQIVRDGNVVVGTESAFTVGPMPQQNDVIYRGGGSLRTLYGQSHPAAPVCELGTPDQCLLHPGEPVWLAR